MVDAASDQGRKRIRAVQSTLDIISTLKERNGAGVTELAREVDVSKGTVHNHLVTLEENGYVVKDEDDTYHLGLKFLDVAHAVQSEIPVLDLVRSEVDELAEKSGELALFTVEEHGVGVCLHVAYGENAVQTPIHVGYRSELHHTAVGKAILAHLPRERVEEIVDRRGLPRITEHTITDQGELIEHLEEIEERGYALNEEESIHGLVGVGAPVKNQDGTILGALSIIGPNSRLEDESLHRELPEMLARSVNIIEVNSTSL